MKLIKKLRKHKNVVAALIAAVALVAGLSSDKAQLVSDVASLALEVAGS